MKITLKSIKPSTRKGKKLMATFELYHKGQTRTHVVHFGAEGSSTYLDHKDDTKKKNWMARHIGNINNSPNNISPAVLSWLILWNKPTMTASIKDYKKRTGY